MGRMMNQGKKFQQLVNTGIVAPNSKDWRVTFTFVDGSTRSIRLTPPTISEEVAIRKAKTHCKIFDETVIDKVEAVRVEKSTQISTTGLV